MIAILNLTSFVFISLAAVILTYKYFKTFRKDSTLLLVIISFLILVFVTFTNILEHLNITSYFDLFEDELEIIFIPMFIFAVFSFCLKKELEINKKHDITLTDSNIRLTFSMQGANEALWEWFAQQAEIRISKTNCFLAFQPYSYTINSHNLEDIIHTESHSAFKLMLDEIANNAAILNDFEFRIKTSAGTYQWVLLRGKYHELRRDENNITYIGTLIDIGNIKNFQSELIQARIHAEENEKLKTAFLNNISHEVRTPMNAIIGFSDLLAHTREDEEKRLKYVQIIKTSCKKLLRTIDDVLDISRINSGSLKVFTAPMHIASFANRIKIEFEPLMAAKGLHFSCTSETNMVFQTDEPKLMRVITNVLDNAIKFTKAGSIELLIKEQNNELIFSIQDTGIGIDKKYHEAVFQNFRQVEITTTREYGGPGLGLSICKGLVMGLGGNIWLESELLKGTTVFIALPIVNTPLNAKTEPIPAWRNAVQFGGKILIAEDEESNYFYLNELVSSQFDEVLHAWNGEEAIEIFRQHTDIQIVLMDMKMPVLNGFEASRQIKGINNKVPIIGQTAFSLSTNKNSYDESYCDSFIHKPITPGTLNCALLQHLEPK